MLGIDYGIRRAYIAFLPNVGKPLVECLVMDRKEPLPFLEAFRGLLDCLDVGAVFIEQPQHLSEALEMATMAVRLESVSLLDGKPVTFVHPFTWRKAVLNNAKANKMDAVTWAESEYGYCPPSLKVRTYEPDHNYTEALAIARYGQMKIEQGS